MKIISITLIMIVSIFICVIAGIYLFSKSGSPDIPIQSIKENIAQKTEIAEGNNISDIPIADIVKKDKYFDELSHSVEEKVSVDFIQTSESRLMEYDPKEYVKMRWSSGVPYEKTRLIYKPDSLPTFYALLDDIDYKDHWLQIVEIISYISDDKKSIPVILNYISRPDKEILDYPGRYIWNKCVALRWIGMIGGEEVDKTLSQALSTEGARNLVREWIDSPLISTKTLDEKTKNRFTDCIQGAAAIGIVLSQNQESYKLVEELYKKIITSHMNDGPRYPDLYNKLIEAKATHLTIQEIGFEKYCNLLGTDELYEKVMSYIERLNDNPLMEQ